MGFAASQSFRNRPGVLSGSEHARYVVQRLSGFRSASHRYFRRKICSSLRLAAPPRLGRHCSAASPLTEARVSAATLMDFFHSTAHEADTSLLFGVATLQKSPPIAFLRFQRTGLATLSSALPGLFHPGNTPELIPSRSTPPGNPSLSPAPILPYRFTETGV